MKIAVNVPVLIPTYNPTERIIEVVRSLISAGFERLIIVDDGSRRSPASSPSASPKIRISAMLSNIKASLPGRGVTKRADSPQIPKPRRNIPG